MLPSPTNWSFSITSYSTCCCAKVFGLDSGWHRCYWTSTFSSQKDDGMGGNKIHFQFWFLADNSLFPRNLTVCQRRNLEGMLWEKYIRSSFVEYFRGTEVQCCCANLKKRKTRSQSFFWDCIKKGIFFFLNRVYIRELLLTPEVHRPYVPLWFCFVFFFLLNTRSCQH